MKEGNITLCMPQALSGRIDVPGIASFATSLREIDNAGKDNNRYMHMERDLDMSSLYSLPSCTVKTKRSLL